MDPDPDSDSDPDPAIFVIDQKTCGSGGSGFATLLETFAASEIKPSVSFWNANSISFI